MIETIVVDLRIHQNGIEASIVYSARAKYRPEIEGDTVYDIIGNLGMDGWRLVNIFDITSSGSVQHLLFQKEV